MTGHDLMADKMFCPGCDAYTSGVLEAYSAGRACPYCGLSWKATGELLTVRRAQGDAKLKDQLAQVIRERDHAVQRAEVAERKLTRIGWLLKGEA